ncbi:DUF6301 family protein [Nocardia sp. NPDC051756]|uniref:DUF6301 family protein n=1 Tax=Nocardia sp. NPDC051756 TaxID=3154751 RepID=UPI00343FFB61
MTEWRALSDDQIVDLARRLRSVNWPYPAADIPELAASFGWQVKTTRPEWVRLDAGFGRSSGMIHIDADQAVDLTLQVTDFVDSDPAGMAQTTDAFARMTSALTEGLGEPTARIPGESAEVRWAGAEATIVLRHLDITVQLALIANSRLAARDRTIDLQEKGLI